MADILIKNVEKWTCFNCPFKFSRYNDLMCPFVGEVGSTVFIKDRHESCPLVELPPHGDLGDLSELSMTLYSELEAHAPKTLGEVMMIIKKVIDEAEVVLERTT